jgi:hypothetical protein
MLYNLYRTLNFFRGKVYEGCKFLFFSTKFVVDNFFSLYVEHLAYSGVFIDESGGIFLLGYGEFIGSEATSCAKEKDLQRIYIRDEGYIKKYQGMIEDSLTIMNLKRVKEKHGHDFFGEGDGIVSEEDFFSLISSQDFDCLRIFLTIPQYLLEQNLADFIQNPVEVKHSLKVLFTANEFSFLKLSYVTASALLLYFLHDLVHSYSRDSAVSVKNGSKIISEDTRLSQESCEVWEADSEYGTLSGGVDGEEVRFFEYGGEDAIAY